MTDRTSLQLRTLGGVRLARADGEGIALRRKPLALLVYLARRSPRPVSRAELATLHWGERGEERARQSLRQALLELKQAIGDSVETTTDSVRLADGAVRLDIVDFEARTREGNEESAAEAWTGEFFPDVRDVASDAFERWVEGERVALHRRLGSAMEKLVARAELREDHGAAVEWATRWCAALALDERAHARLIGVLRLHGRSGEALERHGEFVARVRAGLGADPSREFLRLARDLTEAARTESARDAHRPRAVGVPSLVGFGHEVAEFGSAWSRVEAGASALLLVDGCGGAGKTRLCAELARYATEECGDALLLRTCGGANDLSPWSTAARLLAPLGDAPGLLGASAEALAEVARLVPAIGTSVRDLPAAVGDDASLERSLAHVLAAVSEEGPVLILLDDGHLADASSRRLLASMASRLSGRVAMVLVGDFGVRASESVLDLLLSVPGSHRILLRPLDVADVDRMVASMLTIDDGDRATLAARLFADSGGIPLFVYELLAALLDERLLAPDHAGVWRVSASLEGQPLPFAASLREWTAERVATLSSAARAMLSAAAVLGPPAQAALVETVAELSPADAAAALQELVARRIGREDTERGELALVPPVLARVVYALLAPSERQALHARSTAELATRELTATAERSALSFHRTRAGASRVAAPPAATLGAKRRRLALGIGAGVLTIAIIAVAWGLTQRGGETNLVPLDPRRVVIGAFLNRSGRPALDSLRDIAVDWIARGLDETGLVEVVGMGVGPEGTRAREPLVTDQELRGAARSARAGTIVSGTIFQFGDTIELEAMITDARNGTLLQALPAVRASTGAPLDGANRLREKVVGTLVAMIDPRYDPGAAAVRSPPSYEAYAAFMRGEEASSSGARDRAAEEYRRAAAADSNYSLPVLRLAYASYHMGRCDRVDSIGDALDRRRARLSPFEGHYLERVRAFCRADWIGANTAARRIADLAPRSQFAQFDAASSALSVNHPAEALRRLRLMDPFSGWVPPEGRYWITLALALHMSGDDAELQRTALRLEGMPREFYTVSAGLFAAGALGRVDGVARSATQLLGLAQHTEAPRILLLLPALDELRAHAGPAPTEALSLQLASQVGEGVVDGVAGDTARYAQAELLYRGGDWRGAHALATGLATRHADNPSVVGLLGRTAARLGDRPEAERVTRALERLRDPSVEGSALYVRAQIGALLGARGDAVRLLQGAAARGVPHSIDVALIYMNHADIDLGAVLTDPAIVALLRPGG